MIISMTRLRLRSWWHVAGFARHTLATLRQAAGADGFIDGRLLAGGRLTFWTVTRWSQDDAMRRWRAEGAHGRAMPFLMDWCDEASVARWEQPDGAPFPNWPDCHQRMASRGRPSLVRLPSNAQRAGVAPGPPARWSMRLVLPFRKMGRIETA